MVHHDSLDMKPCNTVLNLRAHCLPYMEVQSLKYRKAFELGVGILQNPISIEGYVYALSFQVAYPL